jgi:radical SAM superfamily enzyme YgiQ (UPF0313 family)
MEPTKGQFDFETGVYRPPSEGGSNSLLLRVSRNCPWNHCTFCGMYKEEKFQLRSTGEIVGDIDAIAAIRDQLDTISHDMGLSGRLDPLVARLFVQRNPELAYHPGAAMVLNWLFSGARTAFLQDADSLIMKTKDLLPVLVHLKKTFPTLERITTYARSKTLAHKSMDELIALRQSGIDRVHVGLESGDDTVLKQTRKGATGEVHILGGRKAKEAGFQLSEYWMPGLGGRALWKPHAINTAKVLSAIDPDYIRSRPLSVWPDTPLHFELSSRSFEIQPPRDHLYELKTTIEHLDVTSRVCFDHAGNYWKAPSGQRLLSLDYEGYRFPGQKNTLLELIEKGLIFKRNQSQ